MNAQEIMNTIALGLFEQGCCCAGYDEEDAGMVPQYRNKYGQKCAIGFLMTEEGLATAESVWPLSRIISEGFVEYMEKEEYRLARAWQHTHDSLVYKVLDHEKFIEVLREESASIAARFGLVDPLVEI